METVASFWYTRKGFKGISQLELLCIKSWLDNGYKFILYTYNLNDIVFMKLNELFDNFELKDANEIIPFKDFFIDDRGAGVAAFSDYFRFFMIQATGIAWVDLDMVCLNNNSSIAQKDYIIIQEAVNTRDVDVNIISPITHITTSLLKFPPNSDFGNKLISQSQEIVNDRKKVPWGIIGPAFLQKIVTECKFEKKALDYKQTCQISWFEVDKFVLDNVSLDNNMFCLHLFSEMWRINHMRKDARYNKNSIYALLLKKHNIEELLKQLGYIISFYDKCIHKHIFYIRNCIKNTKLKLKRIINVKI